MSTTVLPLNTCITRQKAVSEQLLRLVNQSHLSLTHYFLYFPELFLWNINVPLTCHLSF